MSAEMRSSTGLALACALLTAGSARAQNEPSLELTPLVPPKAPWLRKNQKKAEEKKAPPKQAKKTKKKPPASTTPEVKDGAMVATPPPLPLPDLPPPPKAAEPAPSRAPAIAAPPGKPAESKPSVAQPELPLPPLVPLAPPPPITVATVGVLLQNDGLDTAAAGRVEDGLRGVVKVAPLTRAGPALVNPSTPCLDAECLSALASAQKLDQLLVASYARGTMRMRLIDAARKKQLSEAEQTAVGHDPAEAVATAEALACKLMVPGGCTGEVLVDAGEGVQVELDGQPIKDRARVPVGMRTLKARAGAQTAEHALPVSREGAPHLAARLKDGKLELAPAAELPPIAPLVAAKPAAPAAATASTAQAAASSSRSAFTRPAGIAALAIGGALGVAGVVMGAKSHSDLNTAESAFHANGGAWRAGDLQTLQSGNDAARSANILFVASGVLLVTGAVLTFAF